VRAHDGTDAPVEVPAERDLLARRLGVEVDEHVVDAAVQLAERRVDVREGGSAGTQEQVAAEVHDAEPQTVVLDDADAVPGLAAQVVVGPQDRLVAIEVAEDLTAVIGVVAQRDDVDARGEQLVCDLRRDAEAARRVLAVDDDEGRRVAVAQQRQQAQQGVPAKRADDVTDEQDARDGFRHGTYSDVGDARRSL